VDSSNINRTLLSHAQSPACNKIILLIVTEQIPITVITYHCMSICFLSIVITMNEQVVPSADEQSIIVKFLTNGNVKPAEILDRLRAQFGDETLSRTQVYDWYKSISGRPNKGSKHVRTASSAGKLMASVFGNLTAFY